VDGLFEFLEGFFGAAERRDDVDQPGVGAGFPVGRAQALDAGPKPGFGIVIQERPTDIGNRHQVALFVLIPPDAVLAVQHGGHHQYSFKPPA